MKFVAYSLLFLAQVFLIKCQAIEELLDIILSNEQQCGSALDDIKWLPEAMDRCGNKICQFPYQICQVGGTRTSRTTTHYRCFTLNEECGEVIRKELTNQVRPSTWKEGFERPVSKERINRNRTTRIRIGGGVKKEKDDRDTGFVYLGAIKENEEATVAPTMMMMEPLGPSQPTTQGGVDSHRLCCKWAREGACNDRPKFMRTKCQKSCGTIGCKESFFRHCHVTVNLDHCSPTPHPLKSQLAASIAFWNQRSPVPHTLNPQSSLATVANVRNDFATVAANAGYAPINRWGQQYNPYSNFVANSVNNLFVPNTNIPCRDTKPSICQQLLYSVPNNLCYICNTYKGACRTHYHVMSVYCSLSCGICTPSRQNNINSIHNRRN